MTYKEVSYGNQLSKSKVIRATFRHRKNINSYMLNFSIGEEVYKKANLTAGDKIRMFVDDENPRLWCLKKSDLNFGYTLGHRKGSRGLSFTIGWPYYVPEETERNVRNIPYTITDHGLELDGSL